MLSALRFYLSPQRRRFMRDLGRPAIATLKSRLHDAGTPRAIGFISVLLDANAEFMAFALSSGGPLVQLRDGASAATVEKMFGSMLIYSANLFARDDLARNDGELIGLLAHLMQIEPERVMLRRDQLRKAPHSEEWMLFRWLAIDLGIAAPHYDADLERQFAYQYLSYIDQYRALLAKQLARSEH